MLPIRGPSLPACLFHPGSHFYNMSVLAVSRPGYNERECVPRLLAETGSMWFLLPHSRTVSCGLYEAQAPPYPQLSPIQCGHPRARSQVALEHSSGISSLPATGILGAGEPLPTWENTGSGLASGSIRRGRNYSTVQEWTLGWKEQGHAGGGIVTTCVGQQNCGPDCPLCRSSLCILLIRIKCAQPYGREKRSLSVHTSELSTMLEIQEGLGI